MAEKTVLIVDGDAASRNFLIKALQQKGCQTLEASLGREGLVSAWRDRPDLIIAEPALSDLTGEELIRKLRADSRTADTPAIALSGVPDPARKASCLAAGFNEYFRKSSESVPALLDAIDLWLASRQPSEPPAELAPTAPLIPKKNEGLLIVFLSAKGGTGTSSLCANLAMTVAMRQPKARVAVVDGVLPIGSIASIVGYDGGMNIGTLSDMKPDDVNEAFLRENLPKPPAWRFNLAAGSPNPDAASVLRYDGFIQLVQTLQAAYDFIFLDAGRTISQIILPIIQRADLIPIVISPDVNAVRLTKIVWKYLQSKGISNDRAYPILNRVVGFEGLSKSDVEGSLGVKVQATLPYLSGNLLVANNQHVPFVVKFPNDTAAMILKESAAQIIALSRQVRDGIKQGVQNGSWI
jgi:MinD-like ATPase involved in chromosome partitioning or flagellar assembly/CheY-like chemotaxis protein